MVTMLQLILYLLKIEKKAAQCVQQKHNVQQLDAHRQHRAGRIIFTHVVNVNDRRITLWHAAAALCSLT